MFTPDTRHPIPEKFRSGVGYLPVTHPVQNLSRVPPGTHPPECIFPRVQIPGLDTEDEGFHDRHRVRPCGCLANRHNIYYW